ncbi:MAG: helicase-exonuclease AddAB subunit AddB [Firmicutes bacterium]|nr:helicase-exonuclease AddAB subunit AddB [Bacillota bacterium]
MSLSFILGPSGSGKSTFCLKAMAKRQKDDKSAFSVFIVPDQFSFQAEKDLIEAMGTNVIMRAKVLSFTRLAHTVFSKTGCPRTMPLTEVSKAMALRSIVAKSDLAYFKKAAGKHGFVSELSNIITEFFRYGVSPKDLIERSAGESAFDAKLNDLALIYGAYIDFINEGYICDEETLDLLYTAIDDYEKIKHAAIWIDGFSGFTAQEYKIIGRLMKLAKSVTVALTMDKRAAVKSRLAETELFFEPRKTYDTLVAMAGELSVEIEKPVILEKTVRFKSAGLSSLEQNYGKIFYKRCKDHSGIEIYCSSNPFDEIEAAALKIISLVKNGNCRYRDIALVAGNIESYESVIRKVMSENNIPFFMDTKRDISSHPLPVLVKGVLEVYIYNFSFDSVFNLLKTGLTPIPRDSIEKLENYCLAHGIKGYKWDMESWAWGLDGDDTTEEYIAVNSIKKSFMEFIKPLKKFSNQKKKHNAKEITKALFSVVESFNAAEKLDELTESQLNAGILTGKSENSQIWNAMIDIFDSITTVIGNDEITLKEYHSILDSGISVSSLGLIPPALDSVTIGTLERTRLPKIKALFVVGANEGVIPSANFNEGMLKDNERDFLEKSGLTLASDSLRKLFEEQFRIYCAITKPEEKLFISFPTGDLEGNVMAISPIVEKIMNIFPEVGLEKYSADEGDIFLSPASTFHRLGNGLKTGGSIWEKALECFENSEDWRERAKLIKNGFDEHEPEAYLSAEICESIFFDNIYSSVSRLERFSACPYSYFMAYTMKAREREIYRIGSPDLGILFHGVLEDFSNMLKESGKNWRTASENDIVSMTTKAVDKRAAELKGQILLSNNGLTYLIKRLKRISIRAVSTLAWHLRSGDFEPYGYEVAFGSGEALPPIVIDISGGKRLVLTGKIDRVDILNSDNTSYVKIIDYKSGKKSFSLQDVYYGLQMQLLLYMDALLKSGNVLLKHDLQIENEVLPGGVFYFRISDPIISADGRLTAEEIEKEISKKLSLSGLVLNDDRVIEAMDRNIGKNSLIIPVGYKKTDGKLTANSMAASRHVFEKLCDYTLKSAAEIGKNIGNGLIRRSPYKSRGRTPCDYCVYKSVCGFDESEKYFKRRILKNLDKEAVFKLIDDEHE